MRGNQPDTPGSTPRKIESARQHSEGEDGQPDADTPEGSGIGFARPDQVFDLGMDYDDDDVLLDWEQYAGMRRLRCCGLDVSWLPKLLPCVSFVPPEWWYRYSRRQRKIMLTVGTVGGILIAVAVALTVIIIFGTKFAMRGGPLVFQPFQEDLTLYPTCNWTDWRLPRTVLPKVYHLDIKVGLKDPFPVEGVVRIELDVVEGSPCLVMHALNMEITHAALLDPHSHGQYRFNPATEQVTFHFDHALPAGPAMVELHFKYRLRRALSGFYLSTYKADDGRIEPLGATQFEADGARRAFPCFDEPDMKAKFNFTFVAPRSAVALFNTVELPTSPEHLEDGFTRHSYAVTPPMSTYLVAFVVGRLQRVSIITQGQPRNISVWGRPEGVADLAQALQIAGDVLSQYEHMFDFAYPFPKLDLVAIPDFAAGAMENWGLITYRETALMLNKDDSSISNVRSVALTVAHEMAHLWFGDLVTLSYWGDLWLNEGFATYFEHVGATAAKPELGFFQTFFADVTSQALYADARNDSTRPLAIRDTSYIRSSGQIEAFFDRIRYEKGASLLRMLRAYLNRNAVSPPLLRRRLLQPEVPDMEGDSDTFLRGLTLYLRSHKFGNANSQDLWSSLKDETEVDIPKYMEEWTYQPGYPVVTVIVEGAGVFLSQAPFTINGALPCEEGNGAPADSSSRHPWWIPGAFLTASGTFQWTTFSTCSYDKAIYTLSGEGDWIKLNARQYGLYRVNYPPELWDRLAEAATKSRPDPNGAEVPVVPADDYAGLLDDAFALAQAGLTPISNFLNLTRALSQRPTPEYAGWRVARPHLTVMLRLLQQDTRHPACADKWAGHVRSLMSSFWDLVGEPLNYRLDPTGTNLEEEDVQQRLLRPLLLALAGDFGDETATFFAQNRFQASNSEAVRADIRGPIYDMAVETGDEDIYKRMQQIYVQAQTVGEKDRALRALSFVRIPELIQKTLDYALAPEVRAQDSASLIAYVAQRGGPSLAAAWSFLHARYEDIVDKLGRDTEAERFMGRLLESVGSFLASPEALTEVEAIFNRHGEMLVERRYRDATLESISANLRWLEMNSGPACAWLDRETAR